MKQHFKSKTDVHLIANAKDIEGIASIVAVK